MDYRYLGNTGVRVSELCLGTMTFGWKADEQASHQILDMFSGEGGNFIDTADVYADGKSEEILGNWLTRQDRDDFIIATKVRFSSIRTTSFCSYRCPSNSIMVYNSSASGGIMKFGAQVKKSSLPLLCCISDASS